jgi:hypothetical protein
MSAEEIIFQYLKFYHFKVSNRNVTIPELVAAEIARELSGKLPKSSGGNKTWRVLDLQQNEIAHEQTLTDAKRWWADKLDISAAEVKVTGRGDGIYMTDVPSQGMTQAWFVRSDVEL